MVATIKAILIEPLNQTVTEIALVDRNDGCAKSIAAIICGSFLFDGARVMRDVVVWVDDNGLAMTGIGRFTLAGYPHELAGKGIVTGIDEQGETIDSPWSKERIETIVGWR